MSEEASVAGSESEVGNRSGVKVVACICILEAPSSSWLNTHHRADRQHMLTGFYSYLLLYVLLYVIAFIAMSTTPYYFRAVDDSLISLANRHLNHNLRPPYGSAEDANES